MYIFFAPTVLHQHLSINFPQLVSFTEGLHLFVAIWHHSPCFRDDSCRPNDVDAVNVLNFCKIYLKLFVSVSFSVTMSSLTLSLCPWLKLCPGHVLKVTVEISIGKSEMTMNMNVNKVTDTDTDTGMGMETDADMGTDMDISVSMSVFVFMPVWSPCVNFAKLISGLSTDNFHHLDSCTESNVSTFNANFLQELSTDKFHSYYDCQWKTFNA